MTSELRLAVRELPTSTRYVVRVFAYLLMCEYLSPLEVVDQVRPQHREWLGGLQDAGLLVLAGRNLAKTGSVIVLVSESEDAARALSLEDPYVQRGVARYTVVPFEAARWGVPQPASFIAG